MKHLLPPIRNISIFENKTDIVLIGYCTIKQQYRGISIVRQKASSSSLIINDLPDSFKSEVEIQRYIDSNSLTKTHSNVFCLYGFIKLVESYYLIAVTEADVVAVMHGNYIYKINATATITITYRVRNTIDETKYKNIMHQLEFENGFYFSYIYDLTNSLQHIITSSNGDGTCLAVQDMYAWNSYALKPLLALSLHSSKTATEAVASAALDRSWIVPCIYGFVKQTKLTLSDGRILLYTLLARRSRHFAGTRYLRRGVNMDGYVANEVETEQIVTVEIDPLLSLIRSCSLLLLRGSIPLFWSHINTMAPQPSIVIEPYPHKDSTRAADRHFNSIYNRYNQGHVSVVNLVRTSNCEREELIGAAFTEYCSRFIDEDSLPRGLSMDYTEYDFLASHALHENSSSDDGSKDGTTSLFSGLASISDKIYPYTGFFVQSYKDATDSSGSSCRSVGDDYCSFPLESLLSAATSRVSTANSSAVDTIRKVLCDSLEVIAKEVESDSIKLPQRQQKQQKYFQVAAPDTDDSDTDDTRSLSDDDCSIEVSTVNSKTVLHDATLITSNNSSNSVGIGIYEGLLQKGIVRTNCIDCLDRTNVGQFAYAKRILIRQLRALGLDFARESLDCLLVVCMEAWACHGDELAKQYGGSGAMHKLDEKSKSTNSTIQAYEKEFTLAQGASNALVAMQRYYSNVSLDNERQMAMDLILGVYQPGCSAALWDCDLKPSSMRYIRNKKVTLSTTSSTSGDDEILMKLPYTEGTIFYDESYDLIGNTLTSFDTLNSFKCNVVVNSKQPYHRIPFPRTNAEANAVALNATTDTTSRNNQATSSTRECVYDDEFVINTVEDECINNIFAVYSMIGYTAGIDSAATDTYAGTSTTTSSSDNESKFGTRCSRVDDNNTASSDSIDGSQALAHADSLDEHCMQSSGADLVSFPAFGHRFGSRRSTALDFDDEPLMPIPSASAAGISSGVAVADCNKSDVGSNVSVTESVFDPVRWFGDLFQ